MTTVSDVVTAIGQVVELFALPEAERLKLTQALASSLGMTLVPAGTLSAATRQDKGLAPRGFERPEFDDFHLWTDGSCLENPGGAGGWGVVVVGKEGEPRELSGGAPESTNNRMEMTAILQGLRAVPEASKVLIHSDSQYAINCVTRWVRGWKRSGWLKKDGGEVLNRDLIEAVLLEMRKRQVLYRWVKGHAGHVLNERADNLATRAALEAARLPQEGPRAAAGGTNVVQGPWDTSMDDCPF